MKMSKAAFRISALTLCAIAFVALLCSAPFSARAFANDATEETQNQQKSEALALPLSIASTSDASESEYPARPGSFLVYPTIALKSCNTGKYLSATLNGRFAWSNSITADTRFDLLWPTEKTSGGGDDVVVKSIGMKGASSPSDMLASGSSSDDIFGMQSLTNRMYLGIDGDSKSLHQFGFYDRFMTNNASLQLFDESGYFLDEYEVADKLYSGETCRFRIKTADGASENRWLEFNDAGELMLGYGINEPTLFEAELVDTNEYNAEELNVLTSDEWFDIDGMDLGYWDIQTQVGEGKADALRALGYTIMKNADRDVISLYPTPMVNGKWIDLQCAVGVKKDRRGEKVIYDVIITFQGTGGYSENEALGWLVDGITNIQNRIDITTDLHSGYKSASDELWNHASRITCTLDGEKLTLAHLLNCARAYKETAHITLLGHSMGGAVAQCFAEKLASHDVFKGSITGRTFESALATARSDKNYTDWYNICINTDSVSNGTVTNSILQKVGIHRIGKTIVLFDPSPNQDVDADPIAHIALAKHDMNMAVKPLMQQFSGAWDEDLICKDLEGTWVTVIRNAQSNYGPYAISGVVNDYPKVGTVVNPVGYKENKHGNRWFKLDDGSWMYEGNIAKLSTYQKSPGVYYVASDSAPVREICYQEGAVIRNLSKDSKVTVGAVTWNDRDNKWYYVISPVTGWVYSNHLVPISALGRDDIRRMGIRCPVDVSVLAKDGSQLVSIVDNQIVLSADEKRVVPDVDDDEKYLYLIGDEQYTVNIQATDYGSLDCTLESDYDPELGEWTKSADFKNVILEPQKALRSHVDAAKPVENLKLEVIDPRTGTTIGAVNADGSETPMKTSIANARVAGITDKTYSGKAQKQTITVKMGNAKLQEGVDYEVSYKNNVNVGKATITIKGIGIFTGVLTKSFVINPKMIALKKVTGVPGGLKIKWKKEKKQVSGYQIQIALNKAFSKGKKSITVKKAGIASKKVKKLKKGKKYFVRIRPYMKAGGNTYFGKWSKVKSAKTK